MKKIILPLVLAACITVTSCKEHKVEVAEKKGFCLSDTAQKMISIDSVKLSSMEDEIQLSGEVSFDENKVNKVFPRGSGQVIESKVSLGDRVEAGQVLAVIRSAEVAGNYADLSGSEADIKIAKRQLDNAESLYKSGIASERELTEARQNYEKALAAKRKLEATLSINGGSKTNANGTYYLTAPNSGYIVEKKVNAGNFIRQDMGDYLFTISDLKEVWVLANVFEADIPKVKEGYAVKVTTLAYPDKEFKGTIEKVSEVLDPTNKALKVRIRLQNEAMMLKPEMFTKVIVSNKSGVNGTFIPTKSVVQQNGKNYVIVYTDNCNMKIAEVSITKVSGDKTYIGSGLNVGDKIITQNQLLIFQRLLNQ